MLDEGATGEQPGFVGRAYGESDATLMAAADREAAEAAAAVAAVDAAEVRLSVERGKGDPVKVVAAEAMVAAAVAEEARQRAQAVAAAAAAAQPVVVSGRNFAPTPTLRCELHAPAMDAPHWRYNLPYGATGEDHRDAPPARRRRSRRREPRSSRDARARTLPPRPSGTVLAVHVSLGEEGGPPVGPSVAHAVWFDPLARPAVTSVHVVHVSTTCP